MASHKPGTPREGEGVDSEGGPVVDPTQNVLDLVDAANRRQDDLRELNNRLIYSELHCVKETAEIRAIHAKEVVELRAEHALMMGVAETNRLNAIRQVDQLAVTTAAERTLAAVQTLAVTTKSEAENIKSTLTVTATTIATQTANTFTAIENRVAALEKSFYEGKGKQTVSDPMMEKLVQRMDSLLESRSTSAGRSEGIGMSWGVILGVVSLLVGLLAIGSVVVAIAFAVTR